MKTIDIIYRKRTNLDYSLSENRSIMSEEEKKRYRFAIEVLDGIIKEIEKEEDK